MNKNEYQEMRVAAEDTLKSLYIIDISSLSPEQRKQHQDALAIAYIAVIRLENQNFSDLSEEIIKLLKPLHKKTLALQNELAGLKKVTETLRIVDESLNILIQIADILA